MTYTEDGLIEQPAIALFSEMGWEVLNCFDEEFGADGTLGRDNRGEVILLRYLRSALETINPQATALEIQSTIDVITRDRSAMSVIAANEESYDLLREGVKVKADRDDEEDTVTVKVIDWNRADNNHFLLGSQLFITGEIETLAEMVNRITKPRISDAEKLKNLIELKIGPMLERNHLRQNLQEKFQAMIDEYNNGAHNAEQFFAELRKFIAELNTEERRGVREGLDEEELAIFDLLCDGLALSEKERDQVKAIAKELLDKIRDDLVIDWRKKQQAKARVREHIQQVLDNLPASYDADKWNYTFEAVYQHVYQAYRGRGGE